MYRFEKITKKLAGEYDLFVLLVHQFTRAIPDECWIGCLKYFQETSITAWWGQDSPLK